MFPGINMDGCAGVPLPEERLHIVVYICLIVMQKEELAIVGKGCI